MNTPSKIGRSAASLLLAAAIAATLVACAPPAPTPSVSPPPAASPAPTPTATATAEPVATGPEPIIDMTCDELLPDATIAAGFAAPLAPANAAVSMMNERSYRMAHAFLARSLGGLACDWNNGEINVSSRGTNPAYVGHRVVILPDAASQWARFIDYYGPEAGGHSCAVPVSPFPLSCSSDDLVGDIWVEMETQGAVSEAAAAALRTRVLEGIAAAGPGAPRWTPPAGTLPLPTDCEGLVPFSTVASALGTSASLFADSASGGWSLMAGATENAGVGGCLWGFPDWEGLGGIRSLAGGAWAWNEARPALTTPGPPEALTIAGLEAGDQAWIRCAPANTTCVADLVIGGNWIEFHLWPDRRLVTVDLRTAATAIAEGVVATLRP